jgi:hypothetical protein
MTAGGYHLACVSRALCNNDGSLAQMKAQARFSLAVKNAIVRSQASFAALAS